METPIYPPLPTIPVPPDAPSEPSEPQPSHATRNIAAALALVLAGAAGGAGLTHALQTNTSARALSPTQGIVQPPSGAFAQPASGSDANGATGPSDAASIAQRVDPGIVDINTTLGYAKSRAAGTGMVLTSTGEVLTNNHVISGATSISVTDVGNGKTYAATVVGYSKSSDVAVLQLVGASGLTTITPATTAVSLGTGVVGVGNGGGQGGTPSYAGGVVTALDQTITASDESDGSSEQLTGLIQTNAGIVAGDSGGPLVNEQSQVVGMDTAASASYRFSARTEAYAIPIATALQIAEQIESGQASDTVHVGPTAMLGVGVQPDVNGATGGNGALVTQVLSGGPAAAAGIGTGSTIVGVAGHSISSANALSEVMLTLTPGTSVSVNYLDEAGAEHSTTVQLVQGPAQ
jgi:S1-C subfamily serine protease